MKRVVISLFAFAALAFSSVPAHAALIRITPQGMSPAEYEAAGLPVDPAIINSDGFRLSYWGGGQDILVNPVLVIIAVPDLAVAPVLQQSAAPSPIDATVTLGGPSLYGGSWNAGTGFAGEFTGGKVYDFIGLPKGSASENYPNWTGATGITSWNLFVYAVSFDPTLKQGSYVEFSTSLPVNSYVIGYGCEALRNGLCSGTGTTESTPFTFAGLVAPPRTQVPEPGTLALLIPGAALALAGLRRRHRA